MAFRHAIFELLIAFKKFSDIYVQEIKKQEIPLATRSAGFCGSFSPDPSYTTGLQWTMTTPSTTS